MVYKIRVFSDFCGSTNCKEAMERINEVHKMINYGKDKDIYITDQDDYTHVIIMNKAMPNIKPDIPKKNVIGLAFEPPFHLRMTQEFVDYAKKYISKYFIGEKNGLPEPFIEHYSYMWHITPLKHIPIKNKSMSIMISEKIGEHSLPGNNYRHTLVKEILKTNLPIDIYGRGCRYYNDTNDSRLKGDFEELEPYENYDFHICIENCETNDYASEKITGPLLCSTTPIYLGCRNINKYFPDNTITLSGNLGSDLGLIWSILNNPGLYKKTIDPETIKNTVLILRNIEYVFS
uniref:Fucosyltransferase C-terminal domain-containing protein n=1 Tax=viral metagenome TaxID=1070528 RepID=A0A6C0DLH6_9ZZZZ